MSEINLKKNISFTTIAQAITMLTAFVVNWFLARFLGPDLRGRYVYLFTVNSVVWMLFDLGVSKSFMYSLQREKADPRALYSLTLVTFGVSIVVSMLIFAFFSGNILGGAEYHPLVIMALALYIAMFLMHNRQKVISIGMNEIKDYSLQLMLPSILFMILILPLFWTFKESFRMESSFLLYALTMFIVISIFHVRIVKQTSFKFIWDKVLIKSSYIMGFRAFLSEYMLIMMTRVDMLILKRLASFADLGVYALAINFVDIINVTSNMIGIVILNKFAALNDDNASLEILRKVFVLMIMFNVVCIVGMAVLGPFVINFMYTDKYIGAYKAFMYMVPAIFGLTMGSLFNTFLWSKGFPVFTIVAPFIATAIKSLISYFIIPIYGYNGAAISSSIVYPLWFLILLVWYFTTHKESKIGSLITRKEDFIDLYQIVQSVFNKIRGNNESNIY
ncbi:MAG: lipopolysaccharide biosynthesis protein [Candidatus Cloacimonadaceae bacterium]